MRFGPYQDQTCESVSPSRKYRIALKIGVAQPSAGLAELAARLEFVRSSSDPMQERVSPDRTNSAFHGLLGLARLVLAGNWQSTTTADNSGFALLFPTNDLFEDFIGRSIKVALARRSLHLQPTSQ